jgi:hypothetical protein
LNPARRFGEPTITRRILMLRNPAHLLWGGVALFAAMLVTPGVSRSAPPAPAEDFKWVPADSNIVVVVQMDKLLTSDSFKKLRKAVPDIDRNMEKGFREEFGFELSTVERMTVGGTFRKDEPMFVIRTRTALKAADIVKARSDATRGNTEFKEEKVGTRTLHVASKDFEMSFCLLDDMTVVVGPAKTVKPLLADARKAGLGEALQAAAKAADMNATVVVLADFKSITAGHNPGPPFDAIHKAIEGTTGTALTVKVGPDVTVRAAAVCKDAAAAEAVKKAADAGLMLVQGFLKDAGPKVPKELLDVPGQVKTSVKGNLAEATVTVKDDVAIALVKVMFGISEAPAPPKPAAKPDR